MPYFVEFPDGTHALAECDLIRDARVRAFNLLQEKRCGFSAKLYRLGRTRTDSVGFVNDDGMWTRGIPPGSDFFTPGSALTVGWKPISTANPIMYSSEGDSVFYFDAKLFSEESAKSRYASDQSVSQSDLKAVKVDLEPTFGENRDVCWVASESPRSHPFWEVEVVRCI